MRYVQKIIPFVIVLTFCYTALLSAANLTPIMPLLLSSTDKIKLVKKFTQDMRINYR